ncbi:MAG: hypothetical protein JJU02_06595 [Cryomorphaceae bacterium]|nr:hypothetical protein [Cryomorphaceae bacterium]
MYTEATIYWDEELGYVNLTGVGEFEALPVEGITNRYVTERGAKRYELKNHLGNVQSVITDKRILNSLNNSFTADIVSTNDYYGFGMVMPGRSYNSGEHRYGFGDHEKIDEVSGSGNTVDMGDRWLDVRLGRTSKPDRKSCEFPSESPYNYAGNSPIVLIDPDGEKKTYYITRIAADGTVSTLTVVNKYEVEQITVYQRQTIGLFFINLFTSPQFYNTYTYDLEQHITINEETKEIIYGKVKRAGLRSNNSSVRFIQDNAEEFGNSLITADNWANGGGGIVFTSAMGQGRETRKGHNADPQIENIDLLMGVLGVASAAASSKQARIFIDGFKQGVEAIEILNEVNEHIINPVLNQGHARERQLQCPACGDTIFQSQKGDHPEGEKMGFIPIEPVEDKQ